MDLWIRSQDKMKLLKFDGLVIDNTCPEMESIGEYCICDSFEGHIAKYKTKERALEILDEIEKRLIDMQNLKFSTEYFRNIQKETRCVYEMPKE